MKTFHVLFLGNSITLHGICSYWWNEVGMAATDSSHDYVALVKQVLMERYQSVSVVRKNLAEWEQFPSMRSEILQSLPCLLNPSPDLIVVQLSENIQDISAFSDSFQTLLMTLRHQSPNSILIVLDDFWSEEKSSIKRSVCKLIPACRFADLAEIRADPRYQCGIGTEVIAETGEIHKVDHAGVAAHPGDSGMARIAEAILKCLE